MSSLLDAVHDRDEHGGTASRLRLRGPVRGASPARGRSRGACRPGGRRTAGGCCPRRLVRNLLQTVLISLPQRQEARKCHAPRPARRAATRVGGPGWRDRGGPPSARPRAACPGWRAADLASRPITARSITASAWSRGRLLITASAASVVKPSSIATSVSTGSAGSTPVRSWSARTRATQPQQVQRPVSADGGDPPAEPVGVPGEAIEVSAGLAPGLGRHVLGVVRARPGPRGSAAAGRAPRGRRPGTRRRPRGT